MDRRDFYTDQPVTEGELDGAFDGAEQAMWDLATDIGMSGIMAGLDVVEHDPVADLTVDVSSGTAYDASGQRIRVPIASRVDMSIDENGVSTAVVGVGNERWVSLFVEFDRELADERIDGASQQVYFIRNESYQFVVRQGAEAAAGLGQRPGIDSDLILVCDVLLTNGMAEILDADIDFTRRQDFEIYDASQIPVDAVVSAAWTSGLSGETVEDVLTSADGLLAAHFGGTANKHAATAITYTQPAGSWLLTTDVDSTLDGILNGTSGLPSSLGATRVGNAEIDPVLSAEPADNIAAATVSAQLTDIWGKFIGHAVAGSSRKHDPDHITGLDITTDGVQIAGADLGAYIAALQDWVTGNVARRVGTSTQEVGSGATVEMLSGLTAEPTFLTMGVATGDDIVYSGSTGIGGDDYNEFILKSTDNGDGTWSVYVKNGTASLRSVTVNAFRVG